MTKRKQGFRLTQEEISLLEDERRVAHRNKDRRYDRRLRGLLLVGRDGMTQKEAASTVELSFRYFQHVIYLYRQHGIEGARIPKPTGRPPRLTAEQKQEFARIVEDGPLAYGLDTSVWTSSILAQVIKEQFHIILSSSQVRRLLRKMGFSVQYPQRKLSRADDAVRRSWLKSFETVKKTPKRTIS